jgi:tetratricopeptide (TPR) repeat protein
MEAARRAALFIVVSGALSGASAQQDQPSWVRQDKAPERDSAPQLGLSFFGEAWLPKLLDGASDFSYGVGGGAQASFAPLPFIQALGRAGVQSIQLESSESLLYVGGSFGLGYVARLFERLSVSAAAYVGLGKIPDYKGYSVGFYELSARLDTSLRISASLSLGISAGYQRLANPNSGSFLDAVSAGINLKLAPAELQRRRSKLVFDKIETQTIFPVFRSWYDAEALGAVTIRNGEDGPIDNVRVSFYAPEYMGGPRLCAVLPRLERGASATVPLFAVFDERVLSITDNGATSASVEAEYSFYGSRRLASEGLKLSLHHRNAMSWEDDRRAAAFVSPTDPAVLWFSRYASSIVRDRMRGELPPNLQYALGIFEALKLYGLNYVIDPNSSYIELSENAAVVDYLQYPSQTLMYRGGDCDDLSILYCSLLESSGIATAFITIPGHIYMAFDLGMSEAEAREAFFDPGLLLFRDGRAWAAIEITMVNEGFVKAWRVGAKQWIDNERAGTADFFPMRDNWARYKPSGLQDAAARFSLPDEAKAMAAFDSGIDRFIVRELEPIIASFEKRLAGGRSPDILNEYGMAMARVGMLDPAWERFVEAAKAGYAWAWNNLANVAFVRKDYTLAYSYYAWAESLLPGDPVAQLGMARSSYELDDYAESARLYEALEADAPQLHERYSYLASAYGGDGRAWSMADRLKGSIWSKPGLSFKPSAPSPVDSVSPAFAFAQVDAPPPFAAPDPTPATAAAPIAAAVPAPSSAPAPAPATTATAASTVASSPAPSEPAPSEPAPSEPAPSEPAPSEPAALVPAPEVSLLSADASTERAPLEAEEAQDSLSALLSADTAHLKQATVPELALAIEPSPLTEPQQASNPEPTAEPAPESTPIASPATGSQINVLSPEPARTMAPVQQPDYAAPRTTIIDEPPVPSAAIPPTPSTTPFPAQYEARPPASMPGLLEKAPADAEIAAKALETSPAIAPDKGDASFQALPPAAPAPPALQQSPPADSDIALKAAEARASAPAPTDPSAPAPLRAEAIEPAPTPIPLSVIELTPTAQSEPEPERTMEPSALPAPLPAPLQIDAAEPPPAAMEPASVGASIDSTPEAAYIDLSGSGIREAGGSWARDVRSARMTDGEAMYAKLVLEGLTQAGASSYEFKARSFGNGWVGFGLHIYGRGDWRLSSYGGGDSLLIWITSDPKGFGDAEPRLQIYRSRGEVEMSLVSSMRLIGSAHELRAYRIEYDSESGALSVFIDDQPAYDGQVEAVSGDARYVALRALDLAEFSELKITSSSPSPATPGGSP